MDLHDLQPQPGSQHRRRRIGRGISAGQGASGGFGMRGQKSRSGRPTRPGFEGGQNPLYRRVPKLHGFPVVNPKIYTVINVGQLADWDGAQPITLEALRAAGWVKQPPGALKILGKGEIDRPITVVAAAFSASARTKIEAAGGTCQALTAPAP
ncbi:50S ribosomal protein L15 [Gloeomargarita lithophora Alchichica-D10]|uniref:Large ribosomal subunit protein uL15 n=1 Tax=Gloeomargarita lithophora Alchichica-D10 TaxID=1188229 RepID=A0A1J0AEH2_9CYAN|nr:50S ribosomal protein L15 [Gloeomargarita lithophora]APB34329.1 50S ribosomal protein L15 [Gloeomargarita lithophora Alchichica-D10]